MMVSLEPRMPLLDQRSV